MSIQQTRQLKANLLTMIWLVSSLLARWLASSNNDHIIADNVLTLANVYSLLQENKLTTTSILTSLQVHGELSVDLQGHFI